MAPLTRWPFDGPCDQLVSPQEAAEPGRKSSDQQWQRAERRCRDSRVVPAPELRR
jgi:hypothetical protein